jgi:hypothetical protein
LIRYEEVRMFNVRWNAGVHNYMTYVATNFTTGRYDPTRLANLGIGHNAIDAGGRPQGGDDAGDAQAAPANRLSSYGQPKCSRRRRPLDQHVDQYPPTGPAEC